MAEQYSSVCVCVCMFGCEYHIFFIHLSISGHLGCFHVLPIVNNIEINIGIQYIFKILTSFSWHIYSDVELLDHMVVVFFIFKELPIAFYTNLNSHQQCTRFPVLHPHQYLLSHVFLIIAVLTSVWWDLIVASISVSLVISDDGHLFMYLFMDVLFGKNVYLGPLPIF